MIIGDGLIARSLREYDRDDVVFIAAGVSDSKCSDHAAFARERKLVRRTIMDNPDRLIVFFSSYSINDPVMQKNEYVKMKMELENFVSNNAPRHLIVRAPNLVGNGGNPKTVFNFFFDNIITGTKFSLWAQSTRNLITTADFAAILNYIICYELEEKINSVVNIVNTRNFSIYEIVTAIEKYTGKKAVYDRVEVESVSREADQDAIRWFDCLGIETDDYLNKILHSYYPLHVKANAA